MIFFAKGAMAIQYRHSPTGLVFGDNIAGTVKGKVTNYEEKQPGLGVSVGYNAPGIAITIYVYTAGLKSIDNTPSSASLKKHFSQVVQNIYKFEKLGNYKSVKKISEGTTFLRSAKNGQQALFASFSYILDETKVLSKLYLMGYKNHFVKIRFTYDEAVQDQGKKMLTRFIDEIGKMLNRH